MPVVPSGSAAAAYQALAVASTAWGEPGSCPEADQVIAPSPERWTAPSGATPTSPAVASQEKATSAGPGFFVQLRPPSWDSSSPSGPAPTMCSASLGSTAKPASGRTERVSQLRVSEDTMNRPLPESHP